MDEPDFIGKMGTLEDRPVIDGPGRPMASIDVLAIKRWERVKPQAVMAGSRAQGENVLTDAIKDILAMCDVISRMRGEGYQLEVANRQLRDALARAAKALSAIMDKLWEQDAESERTKWGRNIYCGRCDGGSRDAPRDHTNWADVQHADDCIYAVALTATSPSNPQVDIAIQGTP